MGKRQRSANFSNQDEQILGKLVLKYKNVVENKNSDAATWKEKKEVWAKITEEFNNETLLDEIRTTEQLRKKYDLMKSVVKLKATGFHPKTGTITRRMAPLKPIEERIKKEVFLSAVTDDYDDDKYDSELIIDETSNNCTSWECEEETGNEVKLTEDCKNGPMGIEVNIESEGDSMDAEKPPDCVAWDSNVPLDSSANDRQSSKKRRKALYNVLSDATHDTVYKKKLEILDLEKTLLLGKISMQKSEESYLQQKSKMEHAKFVLEQRKMELEIKILERELSKQTQDLELSKPNITT